MQIQASTEDVSVSIAALPGLEKAKLLKIWSRVFPSPPPPKLRKELMVPMLAYRMQEAVHGGLSHSAKRRLQQLIEERRAIPAGATKKPPVTKALPKLVRTWHGETHEVFITDDGYLYRGQTFKKLSPIAKLITGTPWSGPAFFGTRASEKKQ
jgi:hypothetical protein